MYWIIPRISTEPFVRACNAGSNEVDCHDQRHFSSECVSGKASNVISSKLVNPVAIVEPVGQNSF